MKTFLSVSALILSAASLSAQEKITYADHVRPLLENKCFSCHNPDKKKGDLDLTSFAGAMAGGGGGAIINFGDAEGSKLITTTTKKGEPFMPPEGAPLGAKDIEILNKWITGGVLETASSVAKKAAPKSNLTLTTVSKGKPEGPPPMPEHVLLEPVVTAPRTTAVTALAASPWAPLVAVSGLKQALVYDTQTKTLAGIYPYPEGYIRSLKFSQNGSLLIAGGGRGGKMGNAVAWDVKTGKRVVEVGKEFDQVMAADISPNHAMVALGSPSKKLKCYNASTGEELFVMKKHTEWVLAVAFSPDGVLLASADRNGGVFVSEADTGGEFYVMESHKTACSTLAWRADSNVLASGGEDGKIFTYEMENGKIVKGWDAHPGGCLSVNFTPDGNVVSSGRDGFVRVWDINGKKLSESKGQTDLVTKVAALFDSKTVVSGDWTGQVKMWSIDKFDELGSLSSNPSPIAQRIIESEKRAADALTTIPALEAEVKKADDAVKAKEAEVAAAKKNAADLDARRVSLEAAINGLPGKLAEMDKAIEAARARRQAQTDLLKKHEQTVAEIKTVEAAIATLNGEKAKLKAPEQAPQIAEADKKLAEHTAKLDGLKKATATPPAPLTEFEKAVKDLQDQVAALNAAKPNQQKEMEAAKKTLEGSPKVIADIEKQVGDLRGALAATQQKLTDGRSLAAFSQKLPTLLRAAQFNVGVLTEKEKLEKLDADVKGFQEAQKDAEAAKVAAVQRIADAKKSIAEAAAAQSGLEAAFAKLTAEQPAVEKTLEPVKAQEAQLAAQADAHKKDIATKEGEIKNQEQEKANRIAAAQKAVGEIGNTITALGKQQAEVGKKLEGVNKESEARKAGLVKAEGELNAAKAQHAEAAKKKAEATAKLAAADTAVKEKKGDEAALRKAFDEAKAAVDAIVGQTKAAADAIAAKQAPYDRAKGEFDNAEKAAAPVRAQMQALNGQVEAQKKAQAEKQAEPGNAEKDFAAKVQPLQAAIAQAKAALDPVDKQLVEVRAKLAADLKVVEAKRAEVSKASLAVDDVKQRQVTGTKTIESSTKEIADKEKSAIEIKAELAKLEPQLQPLRDKVKQLTDQYFAMLPK